MSTLQRPGFVGGGQEACREILIKHKSYMALIKLLYGLKKSIFY
jgi:hypothetical protein